ncbi:ABC transporter permease [Mucilaginibacter arboris]|uniref:FtsX-like permease family protein n=1 Tax=Mucilaginibacter arboris TaxID=2682090 RepID=A0A7K1SZG4_9SPHI|nr:ABC transporter permease [Mucilaginibacter arboris]MVN22648.1 FtsX-like permease family protein [Mucilaginibacter arboris]
MIKNYFKIAFRTLLNHKAFSFINIIGLAIGMTAFFLIFLYIKFELSYDSFHSKADRIYRVVSDIKTPTETINANCPSWAVASHAKQEFPEIESFVRVSNARLLVRKGNIKFQEENSLFADSSFFQVFDFKLLKGNPQTALKEKFSIILSQTAAKKYFGDTNPVGQTLSLTDRNLNAVVTGLMQDIPENSQIKADVLLSMPTLTNEFNKGLDDQWGNYGNRTYLLLRPGTEPKVLEAKFPAFLERRNGKEMKQSQMYPTLFLEPLREVYLYSTRDGSKTGNITNVYIFIIVAVFILLIACFNFVNLTTARSAERAKEVGIRKVVGAARLQLAKQFIGESIIICLIAFAVSILFSSLLLPLFNQLSGKVISRHIFSHLLYPFLLFLIAISIGILAGIYPALILSSFQPIVVLKGRFTTGTKGLLMRKGLVIIQFTVSIALIISTIIVYNQMNYMRSQDLGFNKDHKLIIDTDGDSSKSAFKQAITSLAGVTSTAMAGSVPGGGNAGAYSQIENVKGDMQVANLDLYFVDFDYIPQYKLKILAGRAFSRDFQTDTSQAMIVNEAAMKMFGYTLPKQIIGKKFDQWGRKGVIVGVVKDFHFRSLQEVIKPLSIRIEPNFCNLVSININSKNIPSTIAAIENKWKELMPNRPFSYYFLDDFFDKQYRSEDRFGRLFLNFAVFAIFISCLGLLGLASYSTTQRTKEIGIRKVMGASVPNILNLLSKEFLKLVTLAFFVAAPIAWYFMHKWLQNFAYHTTINWWVFVAAGFCALAIALATISFQAIKAALANPVKSLRTE